MNKGIVSHYGSSGGKAGFKKFVSLAARHHVLFLLKDKHKQEHFPDHCNTAQKVQPAQPKVINCCLEVET